MKKTPRINGSAMVSASLTAANTGQPVIHYIEAMQAILAYEKAAPFSDIVREELPAIVTHWLQSPEDAPILLEESYRKRWQEFLRSEFLRASAEVEFYSGKEVIYAGSTFPFPETVVKQW